MVAVLAVGAVALGGAGLLVLRGSAYDQVVAAGAETVAAGTARVAITTVADSGVGQAKQRVDATGLLDFGTGASRLEVRVGEPQLGGELDPGEVPVDILDDGTDTFVRPGGGRGSQSWARLPAGEDAGVDLTATQLDSVLRALRPGLESLEDRGHEIVRGQDATHYRATFDLGRAAERGGDEDENPLRELGPTQVEGDFTMDIWIGDEGVHRLSYTRDVPDSAGSAEEAASPSPAPSAGDFTAPDGEVAPGATVTVLVEYYDFGVPFSYETPTDVSDTPDQSPGPTASAPGDVPVDGEPESSEPVD